MMIIILGIGGNNDLSFRASSFVIPAHEPGSRVKEPGFPLKFIPIWIPAFAGMTDKGRE